MNHYGTTVTSQYRGSQKKYVPTGFVQSMYGQNQNQQFNQQPTQSNVIQNWRQASNTFQRTPVQYGQPQFSNQYTTR